MPLLHLHFCHGHLPWASAMGIPTGPTGPTGLSVATKNEAKKGLPRKTRLPAQTY
jgi:hypothetical protein